MNVNSWLKSATGQGKTLKTPVIPRLDAELILASVLKKDRAFLAAHPEEPLEPFQVAAANAKLLRRQKHEPLAYILGYKEFRGKNYKVTPDTLVPRPETEHLIDFVKSYYTSFPQAPKKLIDIGTGSGCIAISLALELPETTSVIPQIYATDISSSALACAKSNAKTHKATSISLIISDLFAHPSLKEQKFDLIIANLPYIDPEWDWLGQEIKYEPKTALFAKDSGLGIIKKLLREAKNHLEKDGLLVVECDLSQKSALKTEAKKLAPKNYIPIEVENYAKNAALCLAWRYSPESSSRHSQQAAKDR